MAKAKFSKAQKGDRGVHSVFTTGEVSVLPRDEETGSYDVGRLVVRATGELAVVEHDPSEAGSDAEAASESDASSSS